MDEFVMGTMQDEEPNDFEVVVDESDDLQTAEEPPQEAEQETSAIEDEGTREAEQETSATEDEGTQEAEQGDNAEEDAELASMPAKFKKRLTREIRLREQIIQEREQIKTAAMQVAQIASQRENEVAQLRKANAALQRQFVETLDYAYERDIGAKSLDLRKAREEGDYDAELKAQSDLDTLRFQLQQVRQAKASMPDPETTTDPQQQTSQQQAQPQQQVQQPTPPAAQAIKWIERNKAWFTNPKFAGHRAFTLAEDARLVNEGYDKTSDEYYTELDRRIDDAFPALRKKSAPARSPVAPAGSRVPATSSRVIKITKVDMQNMRKYGLDPTNKEHLREYARSK